jgi:Icc-related predicted phosphoesterase
LFSYYNMEKATAEELTKFIQFGCWNNINKDGCLENVMKKLNEYVTDVKQDFIVVTGDNYYPQKEKNKDKDKDKNKNKETVDGEPVVKEKKKEKKEKKETVDGEPVVEKKKIIMFKDIDHGFQLLPTNIPIYTILGNHDLETFDIVKENLFVDTLGARREENGTCEIVNKQIETIKALPNTNISYEFFKSVKLANNTLLLMIDTSIYEKPENSNKYLPCYQKIC